MRGLAPALLALAACGSDRSPSSGSPPLDAPHGGAPAYEVSLEQPTVENPYVTVRVETTAAHVYRFDPLPQTAPMDLECALGWYHIDGCPDVGLFGLVVDDGPGARATKTLFYQRAALARAVAEARGHGVPFLSLGPNRVGLANGAKTLSDAELLAFMDHRRAKCGRVVTTIHLQWDAIEKWLADPR